MLLAALQIFTTLPLQAVIVGLAPGHIVKLLIACKFSSRYMLYLNTFSNIIHLTGAK
jgi:hypothetical protein